MANPNIPNAEPRTPARARSGSVAVVVAGKRATGSAGRWNRTWTRTHRCGSKRPRAMHAASSPLASDTRPPVLARRVVFLWRAGQLLIDSATGTDGRPVDLSTIFTASEIRRRAIAARKCGAEADERQPVHDRDAAARCATIEKPPAADAGRCGRRLRPVLQERPAARGAVRTRRNRPPGRCPSAGACCPRAGGGRPPTTPCASGCSPRRSAESPRTWSCTRRPPPSSRPPPTRPHLRDLLVNLITSPKPTSLRDVAKDFCRHLKAAEIEAAWAAELLARA